MSNNAKRTVWLVVAALFAIVGLASLASGRSSGLLCFVVCAWAASRVYEAGSRSTAPETSPSPVSLSPASSPRKDTAKPKLDQTQPDGRPSPSGDAPKAVKFAVDAKLK